MRANRRNKDSNLLKWIDVLDLLLTFSNEELNQDIKAYDESYMEPKYVSVIHKADRNIKDDDGDIVIKKGNRVIKLH